MPSAHPPRILITRSQHQNSALAAQLRSVGAEAILIPTIAIAPPTTSVPLDTALAKLHTFHWIVFTSANAVEAFAERLTSTSHPLSIFSNADSEASDIRQHAPAFIQTPEPPGSRPSPPAPVPPTQLPAIAAIGPATSQALQKIGVAPDLIPPQAVAESLAAALLPHITPGETRILIVRAETARDTLPDTLRNHAAHVTVVPAYRNLIPQDSIPLLQALFANPGAWPDAITFTSSSTAANLFTLLEAAGLALPADGDHGQIILRASIGPITSATLRDLGYPPHLEAPEANIPSLVQTLADRLGLVTSRRDKP